MFTPMVDILPKRLESENFILEHFKISPQEASWATIKSRTYIKPGNFVRLCRKTGFKNIIMSDTIHERETNSDIVNRAEGDVLIAGFGLGMILVPILSNPKVKSVTVVEISKEIPQMILPYLSNQDKLNIVYANIMTWKPPKKQTWDIIYFDIWDHISSDNYEQMKTLNRRFGRKKRIWMGAWCQKRCKAIHFEEQKTLNRRRYGYGW